jgi:bifunctional oligoribonuclease and PAP phosphatase NrnA
MVLSTIPVQLPGLRCQMFFRQLDEQKFKVGFRSKGTVNVALLAQAFGGGGHHNAAGGTVEGSLDEVKRIVYGAVEAAQW